MAILPISKLYSPDFAIPGKKPAGQVEVDRSNPLAKGLFFANVPQHRNPFQDLISGRQADTKSSLTRMVDDYYQQNELSVLDPTIWDIEWPYAALNTSDDSEYTMIWRVRIPDADGSTATAIFRWGADEIVIKRFLDTVTLQWAGGVRLTISSVQDGDVFDLAMRRDSATNDVDHFVDGELITTISGISYTTFNNCDTIRYHEEADQRGEGIAFFYCWVDRKLSTSDLRALHKDPYQLLKPATPMHYFTPTVGVPPSLFQVAWARNTNILIGGY